MTVVHRELIHLTVLLDEAIESLDIHAERVVMVSPSMALLAVAAVIAANY